MLGDLLVACWWQRSCCTMVTQPRSTPVCEPAWCGRLSGLGGRKGGVTQWLHNRVQHLLAKPAWCGSVSSRGLWDWTVEAAGYALCVTGHGTGTSTGRWGVKVQGTQKDGRWWSKVLCFVPAPLVVEQSRVDLRYNPHPPTYIIIYIHTPTYILPPDLR